MEVLLSIVIPIYNVEKYLNECIDSVLFQSCSLCEIILVDDGSFDNCPKICDEYSEKNDIVHVIHKKNGGLSSARNTGLNAASGKYVIFLDADDRLSNGSIDLILKWIKSSSTDVCFMRAIKFYKDGKIEEMKDGISAFGLRNKSKIKVIKYLASRPKYSGSSCTKMYRRAFLNKYSIRFPSDRRLSEDLGFVRDAIFYADSFDALDFDFYQYRQGREGSITSTFTNNHKEGLHMFIMESANLLCNGTRPLNKISSYMMSFVAYEFVILMYRLISSGIDDSTFLTKYLWVLKYSKEFKLRIIFFLSRVFGIKATTRLIKLVRG